MKFKFKELLADYIIIAIGTAIYSAAVSFLLEPAQVSPGGLTGIAVILHDISGFPTGLSVLVLNIPLIILGFINFGGSFIVKTAVSVFLTSFYLDLFDSLIKPFEFDMIISSVFGGILLGFGLGIVMLRGATTGGVDIAVKLINKKFKKMPMGRLFLIIDSSVILLAAIAYANFQTALYSVIAVFISSHIIDILLYGRENGRIFFIISDKGEEIKEALISKANRGVTLIRAEGGYTGNEKTVLVCAARVSQIRNIRRLIYQTDKKAFFFIANVSEIGGEGFDSME